LADHERIGKKFYPPMARAFWNEVHYIERIIPEIAWISYFLTRHGVDKGKQTVLAFIRTCHEVANPSNFELTFCSNYRQLDASKWTAIRRRLKGQGLFLHCLDAVSPFLRCFPANNPLSGVTGDEAIYSLIANEADIAFTRGLVGELYDRRGKTASIIQGVLFEAGLSLGTHLVPDEYPFRDFDLLIRDFKAEKAQATAAHVRMHVNMIYGRWQQRMGDEWARYFWNRGRDFASLDADNHRYFPATEATLHPGYKLGLDFERFAWSVVDQIWERMPVDIYESESFEVLGALFARQCNLAIKLFKNIELWDYHAGPIFLRSMADCIITIAWILKEPLDRARKFISYGLGQEKLAIERLKLVAAEKHGAERTDLDEVIAIREQWVNGQHYAFLQIVDVGSWSGMPTRRMAQEAECSDLYDFAYAGLSHAAHNTWNHVGQFDVWPSSDPLHKHILQPANIDHGYHVDVLENAAKYFDEVALRLVVHFGIKMDLPRPLEWLQDRLNDFYREMKKLETAACSSTENDASCP